MKERYSKPSQTVKCNLCGKEMRARGLKSHHRNTHYLKIKEVTQVRGSETTFTTEPVTQVRKSDPKEAIVVTEKIIVRTTFVSVKDLEGYSLDQRGKEFARMMGKTIKGKSTEQILRENEQWLNSPAGIEYMAKIRAKQDAQLEIDRAKNLAKSKK